MLSSPSLRSGLLVTAIAAGCSAWAVAAYALPMPMHVGQVTYVTGGIGQDEEDAMKASARSYDLLISNAQKDGSFTAGTNLVIRDANGHEVLRAKNTGPLFYAELPRGNYLVDASFNGAEHVRDVTVKDRGAAELHLIWQ